MNEQNYTIVKDLRITGPDMYIIPGLAIIGAASIIAAAGYGVIKLANKLKNHKENNEQ